MLAVATAFVWAGAVFQFIVVLRGGGSAATRWHVVGFTSLALALTVNLPLVYINLDNILGVPNISELIVHTLALSAGWSAHAAIMMTLYNQGASQRRVVRSGAALAVVVSLMTAFFILAPLNVETLDFTETFATAAFVPEYWLSYLLYVGYALSSIASLSWRYRKSSMGRIAIALRLVGVGALLGLAYVALKSIYLILAGWWQVVIEADLYRGASNAALAGCAVFCVGGATFPRWAQGVSRVHQWLHRLRAFRRLGPLWLEIAAAFPHVVFLAPRPRWREATDLRNLDFRLYRRVIEIRDGQLELRRYIRATDVSDAHRTLIARGFQGELLQAATEAALLRVGFAAWREGKAVADWRPTGQQTGSADADGEAQRLVLVAKLLHQNDAAQAHHQRQFVNV